jgi:hypothetical protein
MDYPKERPKALESHDKDHRYVILSCVSFYIIANFFLAFRAGADKETPENVSGMFTKNPEDVMLTFTLMFSALESAKGSFSFAKFRTSQKPIFGIWGDYPS